MNTTRSELCYPQINLMDCVEDYARKWAKPEHEDLDTLSEWVKRVRSLMTSSSVHVNHCHYFVSINVCHCSCLLLTFL
jgi:hypothetical protein